LYAWVNSKGVSRQSILTRARTPLLTVAACTVFVKLAGVAKVLVIARYFGLDIDEFLIAFVIVMFFAEAVSAATTASLVPALVSLREKDDSEAAARLFSTAMVFTIMQLSILAILLTGSYGLVLRVTAAGFDGAKTAETAGLLFIMLPVLLFSGLSATWRGVLNSEGRFAIPAITPALTPGITVLILLLEGPSASVRTLAMATIAGSLTELIVISWSIRLAGYSLFPRWFDTGRCTRRVLRQYGPLLAGAIVLSASPLVTYSMAATLDSGSVAALTYGNKVLSVILAIGPASVATVALPHFSGLAARGEWPAMASALRTYHRLILLATVPVTLMLIAASGTIVHVLFEHRAFTAVNTIAVAEIQRLYLLQLPFAMLSALLYRIISSMRAGDVLMWGAAFHLTALILLAYACMLWRGAAGIALATSIAAGLQYGYLVVMTLRLLKPGSTTGVAIDSLNMIGGVAPGVIQRRAD
jgi:putative peptidoglycan lipid II flippase